MNEVTTTDQNSTQDFSHPVITPSDFLGVDAGTLRIDQIFRTGNPLGQNEQPVAPKISRNCTDWLEQLLMQNTPQQRQRFFDQPPAMIREFLTGGSIDVITLRQIAAIIRKGDEVLLTQLDQLAPDWIDQTVVDAVVDMDHLEAFRWIADRHPNQIETYLGITRTANQAQSTGDNSWRLAMGEDGEEPQIGKFLNKLRVSVDDKIAQWLWSSVEELAAYQAGNPKPWRDAVQPQDKLKKWYVETVGKDLNTLPGEMFAQRAAGLISSLEYRMEEQDGVDTFLNQVRPWLSAPVLRDPQLVRDLLPATCDVSSYDLALGFGTVKWIQALFDDPDCVAGYTTLLKMRANQQADRKARPTRTAVRELVLAEHEMGWSKADLQMETSSSHGLVEAALLVGYGEPLKQLLDSPDGVALVQHVLADNTGPRCLTQTGAQMGWRSLAEHVIRQAPAWVDWRDGRGNTISHWLAFAYNKIDDKTAWTAHQALARAFPQHMSQPNDCGHEPTSWMPKLHSDRIAEQILRRAGRTSAAERTQMAPKKHRTI